MAKDFACALTHVRHEDFFLAKWIAHYSAIVGRQNLFVVIDGDDWEPKVDLSGISVEVVTGAPRQRIRNDRWIAKELSARANALRKRYTHVIRGDVDEYVVIDPDSGLDWPSAFTELGDQGYIFAMGIDMVQSARETAPLDRGKAILGQRRQGFVADRYSKPFVISRWNNWAGGAHRLLNRDVRLSRRFCLFHMALCDRDIGQERLAARGGLTQHASFVEHQTMRLDAVGTAADPIDWDVALSLAHAQFPVEADGSPAGRPRPSTDPRATDKGLPIIVPDRFFGLV